MDPEFAADPPPLRRDESGAVRVGGTRVLLEVIITAFRSGETPEQIAQGYPSVSLADVYAVVAYALRHKDQIDAYLADRDVKAREVRAALEEAGLVRDVTDFRRRAAARPS